MTEENAAAYAAQAILQQNMAALSGAVGPASFGPPAVHAAPAHAIVPGVSLACMKHICSHGIACCMLLGTSCVCVCVVGTSTDG